MTPNKKARTTLEEGTLSQAPLRVSQTSRTSSNIRNRGNISNPLGLTHPKHVARYNVLSSKVVVATHYYDENLLTRLDLLDDISWLFARGGLCTIILSVK